MSDARSTAGNSRHAGSGANALPGERPTIVVRRDDGLGGRLLALVRAMRFAGKIGADVSMNWPSMAFDYRDTDATDWHLPDLFDLDASRLDGVALAEALLDPVPEGALCLETDEATRPGLRSGFDPAELFRGRSIVLTSGQKLLRVASETDAAVAAEMPGVFDRFAPSEPVRAALAAFHAAIGPGPYAALHIRRGDILCGLVSTARGDLSIERLGILLRFFAMRCAPLPLLLASVKERSPRHRIVLIGDDAPLVAAAGESLGDERAVMPPSPARKLGALQTALLDVLILRGATAIHGTASQFSRLAAEVGSADYHVVGPEGDPSPWLAAFEREILDAAGTPAGRRPAFRAAYMEVWQPMADRAALRNAKAERAAMRALRA